MILAKIQVTDIYAAVVYRKPIPAGIVGAQVQIEYASDLWAGLRKTVVFRGAGTKIPIKDDTVVTIPAEVVEKKSVRLKVGVYGVDADNNIVIPTLWADLGIIQDATDPSGDPTTDPVLPVWAQIQAMIGDLSKLDTTAKNNLVAAVNEALTKGGGEVDEATVQRIVDEYLAANPPAAGDPGDDGGYYVPSVSQPDTNIMTVSFAPSKDGMAAVPEKKVTLPAGPTGATPNIKIGAVETLEAGSPATASMTGTPENPILNLGIPQGAPGSGEGGSGIAVTGATVGQTVRIAAVDDNGVPTAWEPVGWPGGCDLLVDAVLQENVASAFFDVPEGYCYFIVALYNANKCLEANGFFAFAVNETFRTSGKNPTSNEVNIYGIIDLRAKPLIYGTLIYGVTQGTQGFQLATTHGITPYASDDMSAVHSVGFSGYANVLAETSVRIWGIK